MKILVCDDLKERANEIQQTIASAAQPDLVVEMLTEQEFTEELERFFSAARIYLSDPLNNRWGFGTKFDGYDIVIIDNNLAQLNIKGAILTAETIVGYIRAFSSSSYFISLNKNPDVDFDLRYLVGDFTTNADLALNAEHLKNPALWNGLPEVAEKNFLPWYWPRLNKIPEKRRDQIEFLKNRLQDSVTDALGFAKESIEFLSLHAQGTLDPAAEAVADGEGSKSINQVTFCDVFLAKDRSLPVRSEREAVIAAYKAGHNDAAEVMLRIVGADIDLWFRRDVCGPQEALVDIPHLLMRMPFLLGKNVNDINIWNRAVETAAAPYEMIGEVFDKYLKPAKFSHDAWVPAPNFWWPVLKQNEDLNELFFKSNQDDWLDTVFCEDQSQFIERAPRDGGVAPTEFSAEFEGSWARRYVARISGVRYAPRTRFAI